MGKVGRVVALPRLLEPKTLLKDRALESSAAVFLFKETILASGVVKAEEEQVTQVCYQLRNGPLILLLLSLLLHLVAS